MKVLFIWDVPPALRLHFRRELPPAVECIFPDDLSEENLCQLAADVEAIVGWRPSRKLLNSARQLKLFQNPGAGVQHLISLFCSLPHVTLANCHGNAYFTAQHAVALLLALTNKVIPHHLYMKQGIWRTGDKQGKSVPIRQKTVGVLGFGSVGRLIAQFLSGFDVRIIACKKTVSEGVSGCVSHIFGIDRLEDFLAECSILFLSLPLTPETQGLIGDNELSLLGPEGLLVNVSRGPVVQEEALYNALKQKTIAGAAIDVWYNYDPEPDRQGRKFPFSCPFHQLDNIILSPHRGASPMDDISRWDGVIENLIRLHTGRNLINVVNVNLGY